MKYFGIFGVDDMIESSTYIATQLDSKIPNTEKGVADGVATLDVDGKIQASQLPSLDGGGGGLYWDATVASGGADYATIGDAVTAGCLKILVTGDTTETANIELASNTHIMVTKGAIVTMGVFSFLLDAVSVRVDGDGEIEYNTNIDSYLFIGAASSSELFLSNLVIRNNSTASSPLSFDIALYIDGITIHIPNSGQPSGIVIDSGYIKNTKFFGHGNATRTALTIILSDSPVEIFNISLIYAFRNSPSHPVINNLSTKTVIDTVHVRTTGEFFIRTMGGIQNLTQENDQVQAKVNIVISNYGVQLTNLDLNGGYISTAGKNNIQINNIKDAGGLYLYGSTECQVSNSWFSFLSTDGRWGQFSNIYLAGNNIEITGNENTFTNFRAVGSFTVSGDRNIVTNGLTRQAIVDTGTDNIIQNNIVY